MTITLTWYSPLRSASQPYQHPRRYDRDDSWRRPKHNYLIPQLVAITGWTLRYMSPSLHGFSTMASRATLVS